MMNGKSYCCAGAYGDEDLLPLSALQHFTFCKRQCALIYIEQIWKENMRTLEGHHLHRKVHVGEKRREFCEGTLILRHVALHSYGLGLRGIGDVIEFRFLGSGQHDTELAINLPNLNGYWKPYPIEYKRGLPKAGPCDEVQLCAQATCLEEMLNIQIREGAIFYGHSRRRHIVIFDAKLRKTTGVAAYEMHEFISKGLTPKAEKSSKCRHCSLKEICMPAITRKASRVDSYIQEMIEMTNMDG